MHRYSMCVCCCFIALLSRLPVNAQSEAKVIKMGKLIQESVVTHWDHDTILTYYIASDAKKIDRFIKKGHWRFVPEKRYTPYNNITMPMIRTCFIQSLKSVLKENVIRNLNPIGERGNIFWSNFYVFVNSRKRFVKLELTSEIDKFLTKQQIYKILRLYSKCELPVLPVVGQFKEKEYYITGASVHKIE